MSNNFTLVPKSAKPANTENGIKYLQKLKGRDKAMRFIQYFSRFLYFHSGNKQLQSFYKAIGLHRKAFKLGTFMDEYIKFKEALSQKDSLKKNLTLLLRAFMAVFVVHDNLVWFLSVKAIQGDKDGIKKKSYYFRFIAAVLNFTLVAMNFQETEVKLQNSSQADLPKLKEKQGSNVIGLVKNGCDLLTYGTNTKWFPFLALNDGQMGIFGAISAIAGGFPIWLKL
eukprot:maker-scaffold_38-snap-gene-0.41-mRNA-1 protein AED:0.00 eAED:0.00 QI:143/1/1/1/1/1/2/90/224